MGVADHAYWLSGLRVRDGRRRRARIDARSHAFGVGDPPLLAEEQGAGTLDGGSHGPLPVRAARARGGATRPRSRGRTASTSTSRASTPPRSTSPARASAATSTCAIQSDGPVRVALAGCDQVVQAAAGTTRRACTSRRRFRIHPPRLVRGRRVARVRVVVNGRRVRVRRDRRGRFVAVVNLRGLAPGRYTVRIASRLRNGRVVRTRRAYRTCGRR